MTGNDVIEEAARLLLSGHREEMNKLAASVSANTTTLQFTYDLGQIRAGALVNIDTETYRVWSVDEGAMTAVVQPAMNGTTSTSHSSGSLVYVNPRISRASIFKAMNDELLALSSPSNGLYAVKSLEFDYSGAQSSYDLPGTSNVMDILDVRVSNPGPEKRWSPSTSWQYDADADTTGFPSGNALFVPDGIPGRSIRVTYAVPFNKLTNVTDDVQTVGLMPPEMQDILALGVLLRLGPVREIKRNFTESQGDSRRTEEVPPNAVGNSYAQIRAQRQMRIDQEAMRLQTRYRLARR
jgi:hypothetical protein